MELKTAFDVKIEKRKNENMRYNLDEPLQPGHLYRWSRTKGEWPPPQYSPDHCILSTDVALEIFLMITFLHLEPPF